MFNKNLSEKDLTFAKDNLREAYRRSFLKFDSKNSFWKKNGIIM
jgi:hypothetical protein